MHYDDGAFYRPLFENNMIQLQVAKGCSYNACKFCDMYHQKYEISSKEEILEDLAEIRDSGYRVPRIFLTGGNAFSIPYPFAVWVLETIQQMLGPVSVGCFARITDIAQRTDAEIERLLSLGVDDISIGSESGLDDALKHMNKGFTAADIVRQCQRLDAIGMAYNLFYLVGMAGKGKCAEATEKTVEIFDQTHPRRIMLHTLTPFRGTPLWEEIQQGTFEPADEKEVLAEIRAFLAQTTLHTYFLGGHYGNVVRMNGNIPENKVRFLQALDKAILQLDEQQLQYYRSTMKSL